MPRFMDLYAKSRTWFALFTRDNQSPEPFAILDIRDSEMLRQFSQKTLSVYNTEIIAESYGWHVEQQQWDYNGYFDALIDAGNNTPSKAQVFVLRYAATYGTWFTPPQAMSSEMRKKTLFICTERGWLAIRDGQYRITSEGRRILRNVMLDERDSGVKKQYARKTSESGGSENGS